MQMSIAAQNLCVASGRQEDLRNTFKQKNGLVSFQLNVLWSTLIIIGLWHHISQLDWVANDKPILLNGNDFCSKDESY